MLSSIKYVGVLNSFDYGCYDVINNGPAKAPANSMPNCIYTTEENTLIENIGPNLGEGMISK